MRYATNLSKDTAASNTIKQTNPCSIDSKGQLSLFEDLPASFDPSTEWLDGHYPEHPHFDNAEKIQFWARAFKNHLLRYVLEGCQLLYERTGSQALLPSLAKHQTLWRAGVSIHKYGVVYLASRCECRDEFLPGIENKGDDFNAIATFLSSNSNVIRAVNYGVHRFINSLSITVEQHGRLIPPKAISALGPYHVAVRPQDFAADSKSLLDAVSLLWDLHDFAHLTAASLAPELYGNKYFSHLVHLPPQLTALIRSPRMRPAEPELRCSDGVVFSEFMTILYTEEVDAVQRGDKTHTYASITDTMAESVARYLRGEIELRHETTGQMIAMKEPITDMQLAVLVQNKAYELTTSEIEQRVMTRGGLAGDLRDEIDCLPLGERIRFLAQCRKWLYFEVRNTIKHRAQKMAYRKVAEDMLAESVRDPAARYNTRLLREVLDSLNYKGWKTNETCNLWQAVVNH
ncbi:hypothetical protein VC83_08007 [Pseudogymnoascus destructans]|uniref:Uncharacterized protein n=1 Tax=Pseudogymnoascus destructans TaxID=655981 RepID=A0A177A3A7_9PEZI|nr:uncharacterized protein VC83_08007 [Pseudogymnoascus destructans]OAF55942.1 hypothetical protein VC83_08007 [Pseudogymnoascus destructans]